MNVGNAEVACETLVAWTLRSDRFAEQISAISRISASKVVDFFVALSFECCPALAHISLSGSPKTRAEMTSSNWPTVSDNTTSTV